MKKIFTFSFLLFPIYSSFAQYMIYGTTGAGGTNNDGIIFKYNPATNKETILFNFNRSNGFQPQSRLLYVSDSLLFGTTQAGGINDEGVVYCFHLKNESETIVINYNNTNGELSHGDNELMQAKDGLLYGTTWAGGANGNGVLFSYNIYTHNDSIRCNFNDSTSLGNRGGPYMELWQDTVTGTLYGGTEGGGFPGGGGVIYGFNPQNNKLTNYFVAPFNGNGIDPVGFTGGLTQARNGLLYGMAIGGGTNDSGTIYSFNINTKKVQTVYSLGSIHGAFPNTNELFLGSNGLFYGSTLYGGDNTGNGVIFSFNPTNSEEKVLKIFNDTDGSFPVGRLVQDPANGLLYGVTYQGGDSNKGILFSYDTTTKKYIKLLDFKGLNGAFPLSGLTIVDTTKGGSNAGIAQIRYESEKVNVYPNPSGGFFQVEITNNQTGNSNRIEVYNVLGEQIYQSIINSNNSEINLSGQPQGVYFYRVFTQTEDLIGEGKIVIEK